MFKKLRYTVFNYHNFIRAMTIEYSIDSEHNLVLVTIIDTIQLQDLMDIIKDYQQDQAFKVGMDVIYDYRQGLINLTGGDMEILVGFLRITKAAKPYKLAMVFTQDSIFGQGRMFDAYAEDLPSSLKLFRDMPSCLQWINSTD